jgi:hypothetical protein
MIQTIFSYDKFTEKNSNYYDSYDLAYSLGINSCPYCNRAYTFTVSESKDIIRPELDHFFSQSRYPLLSISFYNLIPSCHTCNSNLKGKTELNLDDYLHPYLEGFDDDAYFTYTLKNYDSDLLNINNYALDIEISASCLQEKLRKINSNIRLFKLKEIYNYHREIIGEIKFNYDRNSKKYIESLDELTTGISTQEEIFRFYFNNYLLQEDFIKRVLSKYTRDIVKATPGFEKLFN